MHHLFQIKNEFIPSVNRVPKNELTLRDGQIVQGKILKIFPNNRAEIQIGNHKLVAEITTSLQMNKQYFFQVRADDTLIHLKVLREQTTNVPTQHIAQLLQQLQIKPTKQHIAFIQQLIADRVPFQITDMQQAIKLMENHSNIEASQFDIIKKMIEAGLPMTNHVFEALIASRDQTFSSHIEEMVRSLAHATNVTEKEQTLLQLLKQLRGTNETFPTSLAEHIQRKEGPIASLLQYINTFEREKDAQIEVSKKRMTLFTLLQRGLSQTMKSNTQLTTTQKVLQETRDIFTVCIENQSQMTKAANKLLQLFSNIRTGKLPNEQFILLKQMVHQQLYGTLPMQLQQTLDMLLDENHPDHVTQLHSLLQILCNDVLYRTIQSMIQLPMELESNSTENVQQRFLTHLHQYMNIVGLQDEQRIKTVLSGKASDSTIHIQPSIKMIMLQMMQEPNTIGRNKLEQFVHFIHGMQLQSVQETNHFLHCVLQLPGENIGLHNDLFLHFEGRKNRNGKIDPNHCRILFVLDLKNMKETMVDVTIQKRIISITIYNEQVMKMGKYDRIEKMLEEALKKNEFTLSQITYKPLFEIKKQEQQDPYDRTTNDIERYDFRI
ncbi:hypothetical protein [Pseudogracilibacillus sp. ICA-222130]|uniref:hypothetical protein n=1 Tax=Pseudogracilibacillus sp. ICA-222130 TaxID=3134655 RepID=UPI0030C4B8C8